MLPFKPIAAGDMKWRVGIGAIDQHIGIDDEHLAAFHRLAQGIAVGDVDHGATTVERRQSNDLPPRSL